ncbi:MAG: hypothetical protein ACXAEU_26600 [Candidatus Hodarchaeales archaeon]|jgi:hypothetical protein
MINPAVKSDTRGLTESFTLPQLLISLGRQSTLTIFHQNKLGPSILSGSDKRLPFNSKNDENDLQKLGNFFSVAIGQGSCYNTGCFGPLPVLSSEYNCLVYSVIVKDKTCFDPRMMGWNYLLICFFYHKSLDRNITDSFSRIKIENYLENYLKENNDIRNFTPEKIGELKKKMIYFLSP